MSSDDCFGDNVGMSKERAVISDLSACMVGLLAAWLVIHLLELLGVVSW